MGNGLFPTCLLGMTQVWLSHPYRGGGGKPRGQQHKLVRGKDLLTATQSPGDVRSPKALRVAALTPPITLPGAWQTTGEEVSCTS